MPNLKVLTNVPVVLTFKYDSFKEWNNQGENGPYKSYSIAVTTQEGEETYFGVYEREYNDVFKPLEPLKGRTLEILKYEDGKYKSWKVLEGGKDITPRSDAPKTATEVMVKEQPQGTQKLIDTVNTLIRKVKDLESRVQGLETLSIANGDKDALELHQSGNEELIDLPDIEEAFPGSTRLQDKWLMKKEYDKQFKFE